MWDVGCGKYEVGSPSASLFPVPSLCGKWDVGCRMWDVLGDLLSERTKSIESKKVSESRSIMTQLVLPRDSNSRWGLYGGKLMDWIDSLGAVVAMRHSNQRTVTAAIE